MMLCYSASEDHRCALAETHSCLGQAEHLAALPLWRRDEERRACCDLEAVENAGCEQDQQRERKCGAEGEQGKHGTGHER
jgi:hypothetical protein